MTRAVFAFELMHHAMEEISGEMAVLHGQKIGIFKSHKTLEGFFFLVAFG